jgi:hypothetical protein
MKHTTSTLIISAAISSLSFAGEMQKPVSSNTCDFLAPFEHIHASKNGTPYAHSFGIEPAFTGRDLFIDHTFIDGDGFVENETEIELEWAFTKRLGMIVEVPYVWEDEEGVSTKSGFGDLAVVPRAILIEQDRFLLTAQTEIVLPTGSRNFGGETAIAPGIAMWNDLGSNFTLNSIVSVEHGFDTDETELIYGLGLVKSFGENHAGHDHSGGKCDTSGMLHLHLEITGSTPVNGADQGDINLEGLVGVTYGIAQNLDIRTGYFFPLTNPNDFGYGITAGLIYHF